MRTSRFVDKVTSWSAVSTGIGYPEQFGPLECVEAVRTPSVLFWTTSRGEVFPKALGSLCLNCCNPAAS